MIEEISEFIQNIAVDLDGSLPGPSAQFGMAPQPRNGAEHGHVAPANAKVNGVLILLYAHERQLYVPLILRPVYTGVHSGQVSLPGGRMEACDRDVMDTALREAEEEIGVIRSTVRLLGKLTPLYIGASNNIVYPSVGWTDTRPPFHIDDREVDLLIEVPLNDLRNPDNVRRQDRIIRGGRVRVPYYSVCDQMVWGATAMILNELLSLPSIQSWRW